MRKMFGLLLMSLMSLALHGQTPHPILPLGSPAPNFALPGVDGKAKMSKSRGNTVPLSASDADIEAAVQRMYTDPNHLRASNPGKVEGNVVFTYLDAFDPDADAVAELKAHYRRGGLGDMILKRRLTSILQATISPIRERRAALARDPDFVMDVLRSGTARGRDVTERTKQEVVEGLGLFRL